MKPLPVTCFDERYEQELEPSASTLETRPLITIAIDGPYETKENSIGDESVIRSFLITKDPNICQGEPIIKGTRISVSNIVELSYILKWDISKIQDEYPQLNDQQIIAAQEYYQKHIKEIDLILKEEKEIDASNPS